MLLGLTFFGLSHIIRNQYAFGFCDNPYSFGSYVGCLDKSAQTIGKPLFFLSLALLVVVPFLFFVSDFVFKKWLRFSVVWFIVSLFLIMLAPVTAGGWMPIDPEKWSVSILMSTLFVILSLGKLAWDSKRSS